MFSKAAFAGKLLLACVLAWSAAGFASEMRKAISDYSQREHQNAHPVLWRFGMPRVDLLARCAEGVRENVPAGGFVAFYSTADPPDAAFFRWRWAAYFLPELHVLPMNAPETAGKAQFLVAFRSELHHPRAEPMAWLAGCRLYRVLPK